MLHYYGKFWEKYFDFSGRSQRAEYWIVWLFHFPFSVLFAEFEMLLFSMLFSLIVIIPGLALAVRRLHDTGRSAWWLLISLIPLLGIIWFLVLMCLDSQKEVNKYGVNPKQIKSVSIEK